jgi:ornithine carbamoyltransferase
VSGVQRRATWLAQLMPVKCGVRLDDYAAHVTFSSQALPYRSVWSLDAVSRSDLLRLLSVATRLKQAARDGVSSAPLRGKNLALLGHGVHDDAAVLLREAATALGAKVACLDAARQPAEVERSARLLGRLYDAVDCGAMAPELLRAVERDAGVPVFNGLAADEHPTRVLAVLLALSEARDAALSGVCVRLVGDPDSLCGKALRQAAVCLGLQLRMAERADAVMDADFVLDTTDPARWTLADRQGNVGANEREDRRYTLQALLVSTMV